MRGEDSASDATRRGYEMGMLRERPNPAEMTRAIQSAGDALAQSMAALEAMDGMRLASQGGYPAVITDACPGFVLVAEPGDGNGVELPIYPQARLVAWYRRACEWLRGDPEEDLITAMDETAEESDEL